MPVIAADEKNCIHSIESMSEVISKACTSHNVKHRTFVCFDKITPPIIYGPDAAWAVHPVA